MLSLIQNEWIKWWSMKKSKIVFGLYIVVALAVLAIGKYNDLFARDSYFSDTTLILSGLLGIITIVFTAELIGNEMRYDTMKHLLMSPYTRMSIYFAKLSFAVIVMLLQFFFIVMLVFALSYAFSGQFGDHLVRDTLMQLVGPVFTIIMTLFFSLLFRSVGMIIGFTVLAQFFTSIVGGILIGFKPEIAKWIVFMHLDWSMYYDEQATFIADRMGTNLTFSAIFVLAHMIVLLGGSLLIFQKKSYL